MKSPASQFQSAAKKTFNEATANQEQQTASLQRQTGFKPNRKGGFIGTGPLAPTSFAEGSELLAGITGVDPAGYVAGTRAVYPQLQGQTDAMRGALASFKPRIIDSGSTRKTTDYIRGILREYESGLVGQTEAGVDSIWKAPGKAREAFETSFLSPSFNLMRDPQAMNMAEDPNTVSQLTDPRFQKGVRDYMEYGPSDFYNYNV